MGDTLSLTTIQVSKTLKTLTRDKELVPGDKLKIELDGDELSVVVPAGKKWATSVSVYITETDNE